MASKQPTPTVRELIGDLAPKLTELSEDVLFGDIWERPGLSKREYWGSSGESLQQYRASA